VSAHAASGSERSGQELVDALMRRFDLEVTGYDGFRGLPGRGDGLVFGGMLLAQGLVAAARTTTGTAPHALHAHFLRGARYTAPLDWAVERVRDGFRFATRRVVATQGGRLVFTMVVGFTPPPADAELTHADSMPAAPAPETLDDWEDLRVRIAGDAGARRPDGPLEVRECDPDGAVPAVGRPARRALWMRPRGVLPDDPVLHAAMLAYASDRGLLSTAARPHGLMWGARQGASLDHALWLHRPWRFDGWLLCSSESPVAVGGRGFVQASMYGRDGVRVASIAQEGLVRRR
jgi:acyl-CoA thioesterase-2